ncbi:hypothetical protein DF185_13030 [Marinifilum breve]|uniref:Pyrrolo-quinoline quinone repeat domain-containing protein n=1 Tax=Marinifilum breve TaxID=2184082 RepID=A0A2V3ZWJ2_9BACT|nr:PQQ-binding-like beta-propeller repeat protein [Marinifilum breve]PXY00819.1 hypothetical protein DF185_13030 [Marinifilum breve]
MKLLKHAIGILVLFFLSNSIVNGQNKIWEQDLRSALGEVNWIEQTNEGFILASGTKGLLALDNKTGKTLWHNSELRGAVKESLKLIEGLPICYMDFAKSGVILNSSNGEILYDTKKDGVRVQSYGIHRDKNLILFEMSRGDDTALMSFDLKTWKKKWITNLGKVFKFLGLRIDTSIISQGPFFTKKESIILSIKNKIFDLDLNTGELLWSKEWKKPVRTLIYSPLNNCVYVGVRKHKKLIVLNPKTGEDITPGKFKLKGELVDVIKDQEGNLILVENYGFNLINPETNGVIWPKKAKVDNLHEVIPHEKGYFAICKEEKKGDIYLFDKNGKKIWKQGVNGYVYYAVSTSKGMMYISTENSNILNFENGKKVWDKTVKFRAIPAVTFDPKEKKVILFENKKGYKFDLKTGDIEQFADEIKLEKVSKSTPLEAEYITNAGYLLTTPQHISLLGSGGELKYTQYYKPASSIKGVKGAAQFGLAVAGIDFDIDGAIGNINKLSTLANGEKLIDENEDTGDAEVQKSDVIGLAVTDSKGVSHDVFRVTRERYYNSKKTKNAQFIVSAVKEETGKKHFIYKVDKKSGNVDYKIELTDKTPSYLIDDIDNVIVINEKSHLITAYQF